MRKGPARPAFLTVSRRIGAPNQRKSLCHSDFELIRKKPRCRQSVSQNNSILERLKAALWKRPMTMTKSSSPPTPRPSAVTTRHRRKESTKVVAIAREPTYTYDPKKLDFEGVKAKKSIGSGGGPLDLDWDSSRLHVRTG